jgi:hypothetical protein
MSHLVITNILPKQSDALEPFNQGKLFLVNRLKLIWLQPNKAKAMADGGVPFGEQSRGRFSLRIALSAHPSSRKRWGGINPM